MILDFCDRGDHAFSITRRTSVKQREHECIDMVQDVKHLTNHGLQNLTTVRISYAQRFFLFKPTRFIGFYFYRPIRC